MGHADGDMNEWCGCLKSWEPRRGAWRLGPEGVRRSEGSMVARFWWCLHDG